MFLHLLFLACYISIHALLAESDLNANRKPLKAHISIHALLAESDAGCSFIMPITTQNFYPRSPCGERRIQPQAAVLPAPISIHALLAESDGRVLQDITPAGISIHALLAESDMLKFIAGNAPMKQFLSTLSLRRATSLNHEKCALNIYFYPRSPCGERLPPILQARFTASAFLSTLSLRRATTSLVVIGTNCVISIHALLAESDVVRATVHTCRDAFLSTLSLRRATGKKQERRRNNSNFYPRSPCGERPREGR